MLPTYSEDEILFKTSIFTNKSFSAFKVMKLMGPKMVTGVLTIKKIFKKICLFESLFLKNFSCLNLINLNILNKTIIFDRTWVQENLDFELQFLSKTLNVSSSLGLSL